jgi:hypothetical protein
MTTIKLAWGIITTSVDFNYNRSTRDFIKIAQDDIKNLFQIEEGAAIEIVEAGIPGVRFGEMKEKLPETDEPLINYVRYRDAVFYARVVLNINNEAYIKTDRGNGPVYFKKTDYNGNQTHFLTETQIRDLRRLQLYVPETCGICYENEVQSIRVYQCRHLFCGTCISNWIETCALCRSPCRLN